LQIEKNNAIIDAVNNNISYICSETLTDNLEFIDKIKSEESVIINLNSDLQITINIKKTS